MGGNTRCRHFWSEPREIDGKLKRECLFCHARKQYRRPRKAVEEPHD